MLSHTWDTDDQEIILQGLQDPTRKRDYRKTKFCGEQAQRDGFQYVWVDSCCIDKTNSVELSEAIYSMFAWYRIAEMCYVYLAHVLPLGYYENKWQMDFKKSRWFTRGWTLTTPRSVELFPKMGGSATNNHWGSIYPRP
jgi:hypothetical protein